MVRRSIDTTALVEGVVAGDRRLLARCLRIVDDSPEQGRRIASLLHPYQGTPQVLGFTGNPGAGKSTIVDQVISLYRSEAKRVAVLAVDPSSPFSGGAILGDRIRMSRHFDDDGVYIRSLATRGALGGLSRSAFDSVRVLDAAGFDVVIIETVGVGQDEVDVVRLADTTVVVLVPGMGDDVQAIKAGLLEIADIFLVNKADRDGAAELERALRQMLTLVPDSPWDVPIVRSVAPRGEGMAELVKKIARHRTYLQSPAGQARLAHRAEELFDRILDTALIEAGRHKLGAAYAQALQRVANDAADPYAEVLGLLGEPV